jgi:Domain of unknown function (DUF4349)
MSTVDLLRTHAPTAPDGLRERVLAQRPARPRVRPVLVLAALLALAVAAAIVYGITDSQPQRKAEVQTATSGAVGVADSSGPSLKAAAPQRIQHTDASITVRVGGDIAAATTRATRIATSLGGYAQSVQYTTPRGVSYLELRVPAQNVKAALAQLAGLGDVVGQQLNVEDLTARLEAQSAQIEQLRRRVAALNAALRNPSLPESERVLLQIKRAEAKRALAQRINARKGTVAAATSAHISLVLTNEKDEVVPVTPSRFDRMLDSALEFLAIEGLVLLFALIVASPFAIGFGLLWIWRRRAAERVLME